MYGLAALVLLSAPTDYDRARADLESTRQVLAAKLDRVRGRAARKTIYAEGRAAVVRTLTEELFPAWYGTPWAFGGHSDTPGKGQIACGVFVGRLLQHAGFRLNPIRMGQLASEHIALSLTEEKNLRRFRNRPVSEVEKAIIAWGPGLYAVGLDTHAGLAVVDTHGRAHFIHSTAYDDQDVRSEPFDGPNPLKDSRYRVFAKLLDDRMIHRWLVGYWFKATKGRPIR